MSVIDKALSLSAEYFYDNRRKNMINLLIRCLFGLNTVKKLELSRKFFLNAFHKGVYLFVSQISHTYSPFLPLMQAAAYYS